MSLIIIISHCFGLLPCSLPTEGVQKKHSRLVPPAKIAAFSVDFGAIVAMEQFSQVDCFSIDSIMNYESDLIRLYIR